MKRRTLDLVFAVGGLALAVLLLVLGLVLKNQANFAKDYVKHQLTEQKINFSPVSALSEDEKKVDCLVKNAEKQLVSGKQAECYANEYIGDHLKDINEGKTYSESSSQSRAKRAEADAALKADPNSASAKALDTEAKALAGKTDTLFKGETLRGLLLTSYGFSIFGDRADVAATVCMLAALVLLLATVAGFIHALKTPTTAVIGNTNS
jgi:hypothetical protein